jgi:uncharacterized protein
MLRLLRRVLSVLLLAAIPAVASETACPPAPSSPAREAVLAAVANARDHGFLWRISKDGRTSFLYGTVHVAKLDWMFPGPTVLKALREVDTVALELDGFDPDIRDRMIKGMAAQSGGKLPEPLAQRMRKQMEASCVTAEALGSRVPELQVVGLSLSVARQEGLEPAYAIDTVLADLGHRASKHMFSLETPESQLRALQMRDAQETAAFVEIGLEDLETGRGRAKLNRLTEVWVNADYAAMERFGEWCDCLKTEFERKLMKRLLDDRNPALAGSIDALHRGGKQVFAAVGSLHMFGPLGLPTLMAQRGYRVERLDYPAAGPKK